MKMMKLLAALAVMGVASVHGADNQLLYWALGDTDITYDYATIDAYLNDGSILNLEWYNGNFSYGPYFEMEPGVSAGAGLFNSAAVDSFFVQLWTWSDDSSAVGWQRYAKSSIEDKFFFSADTPPVQQPFYATGIIPEPTSGLLLLFGVAGLALKRRRQAV